MGWLLRHNWAWALLAFAVGAVITWLLLTRRERTDAKTAPPWQTEEPVKEEALVGAGAAARTATPPPTPSPAPPPARTPASSPPSSLKQSPQPIPAETIAEPVAAEPAAPPKPEPAPAPDPAREPEQVKPKQRASEPQAFSRRMDVAETPAPTLFDDPALDDTRPAATSALPDGPVPVGRYGEGSADAVPHQGPPDGFTIKGNAQSMLFHTPDSPYYGRTKPEVWFRTEADAERAGFSKYVRKPRKTLPPRP